MPASDEHRFCLALRQAVCDGWAEIQALERDPRHPLHPPVDSPVGYPMAGVLADYLSLMRTIVQRREAGGADPERERMGLACGQRFIDQFCMYQGRPTAMWTLKAIDDEWQRIGNAWAIPADGILDLAARSALEAFAVWAAERERRFRARQAEQRLEQAAQAADGQAERRQLPHQPDARSLLIMDAAAANALAEVASQVDLSDPARATPDQARIVMDQVVIRALVEHWAWTGTPPARTLGQLSLACDFAVRGLPGDPALHAWTYEQWQHIALAARHPALSETLWAMRRDTWDTKRIRPVNWLVCRIRILDLLQRGGLDSDLRGLLEMSRIGLFDDPLPSELEPDLPLMRNWHHLLHSLVFRDGAAFIQRLAERQELLAAHWRRGGGVSAAALLDMGGLALARVAASCGLTPAHGDHPYLPRAMLES